MASDRELRYIDTTPAPRVSKASLVKMIWRSTMLQASFNYERMQSGGWLWAMLPGLQEIHKNKKDLSSSMIHNMDFINTHPFAVTFVMGIVLSMEQLKTDIQTIRSVRIAVAAPLGGIGDALFWYTLVPITAGLCANMAIDGSVVGPLLYFTILFGCQMALRYGLMYSSCHDRICPRIYACRFSARRIHCRCPDCQLRRRNYPRHGDPERRKSDRDPELPQYDTAMSASAVDHAPDVLPSQKKRLDTG